MSYPVTGVLNLIPSVYELNMIITRGGGWTLGLVVTDPDTGLGLDLTGKTATLHLPGNMVWTAEIEGSRFVWDMPKSTVDSLGFQVGDAHLAVSDGSNITVWAKGKARVV